MKSIFISHSSLDDDVCSFFKDMLVICGMDSKDIMYTSAKETGLEYMITPEIKNCIKCSIIDIIFLSPNYLKSVYCCTEMGALAIKETPTIIFGIKGINYKSHDGLQGRDIYVRDFSKIDDLIQVLDLIENKLGVNSKKSSAYEQAKKVVNNYKTILEKTSITPNQATSENLLNVINSLKAQNQGLLNANKELNEKLNMYNSIAAISDVTYKEIYIQYSIGTKSKEQKIVWKQLFFVLFANREEDMLNASNIDYWLRKYLNKKDHYNISSYDNNTMKKRLSIDDTFLQKYLQELISYNLIIQKSKVSKSLLGDTKSYYYVLTIKGVELLKLISRE